MIDIATLDWSKCKLPPFEHQMDGVRKLISYRYFGILDEMGAGKTKQIIDAAGFLYEAREIDTMLIICPAQAKDTWIHERYSQIIEHSFVRGVIHEFTSKSWMLPDKQRGLTWIVTSVELLRNPQHVNTLIRLMEDRTVWTVVDESSVIANHRAAQTKGVLRLRARSKRRTILNGTPVGNSILDLYSQFDFLDPVILGFRNYYAFRNHHARMGGFMNKQVVGFYYIEEIQAKIKPYVLRRLKSECLDILPKMKAPLIEVRLTQESWNRYVSMRDEFVAYLNSTDEVSIVTSAPVKALRLAQMCSGFLGGVDSEENLDDETPLCSQVSCELTNAFLDNLEFRLSIDPKYKLIVWCRFRPEIARLHRMIQERFPKMIVKVLQGGQGRKERDESKSLFHPTSPDPEGSATLIGQPQAGRFSSNFAKCSNVDYLSNSYSLLTRSQSEDRVHRPGQINQVYIQDYCVVGPNRERTISGIILKALRTHDEMAKWTCSRWTDELMQEDSNDIPF